MIRLLAKIFIHNSEDVTNPEVRRSYGILCGACGIGINILLFLGKLFAGFISGSIAIMADAMNNLSDAGSSIITLLGFKLSGQEPDPEHPFGHGRMEYLSGLFVSVAILLMAFELLKSSFDKILHPEAITFSIPVVIILLVSILGKIYMFSYNHSVAKKINSPSMDATAKDSLSDTLSTTLVLLATLVAHFFQIQIDGYCGLLVAVFIFFTGISAMKETIAPLLGQAPEEDFVKGIEQLVLSHEGILGIHDLIVHDYGPGRVMISLHAEVPSDGDLLELHDIIDNIEHELREKLHCEATIHMDPVCMNDSETQEMKSFITGVLCEIDSSLTLHDFRVVSGTTHTNLIFDIVLPYKYHLTDDEVKSQIIEKVHSYNEKYFCVIQVDKKYTK